VPESPRRIVIDTNTLLRGMLSETSAAAKVRRAAEERVVIPLFSKPVLDEYRAVLSHPNLQDRFPDLTARRVAYLIKRLIFVGEYVRFPHAHFEYPRDITDQKFLELAIELEATHIISSDKDLLSLPKSRSDAGKRFRQRLPQALVVEAGDFIARDRLKTDQLWRFSGT
jgi:putative PIN family toxin of toxin-antitoxin system